jgi:hypothetical protein
MHPTSTHAGPRRAVAALAVTATLAIGGVALGDGVAAADPGSLATRGAEPTAVTPSPAVTRWLAAVATCSTIYPPGTDLTSCIANLY